VRITQYPTLWFRGRSLSLFTGGRALVAAAANAYADDVYEYVERSRTIELRGSAR